MFDILLQPQAGVLPVQHGFVTDATDHVFWNGICKLSGVPLTDVFPSLGVSSDAPPPPPMRIGETTDVPLPLPPSWLIVEGSATISTVFLGATEPYPPPPPPTK